MTATITPFPTRPRSPATDAALDELLQLGLTVARIASRLAAIEDTALDTLAAATTEAAQALRATPATLEDALRAGHAADRCDADRQAAIARVAAITETFEKAARAVRRTAALQARLAAARAFENPSPARAPSLPASHHHHHGEADPADRPENGDELRGAPDDQVLHSIHRDLAAATEAAAAANPPEPHSEPHPEPHPAPPAITPPSTPARRSRQSHPPGNRRPPGLTARRPARPMHRHRRRVASMPWRFMFPVLALLAAAVTAPAHAQQSRLDAVKARGYVICGVTQASPGFANPDSTGVVRGLDADSCRAIAAALFNDPAKARFVPLLAINRLLAVQTGEVDVLFAQTTWTLGREAGQGLEWASVTFYDGEGFMVSRTSGITAASGLDGATICMVSGGTSEGTVADWFSQHRLKQTSVMIESGPEARGAFLAGRCDAYTQDMSALASFRSSLGERAADYLILPDIISNEPLGAAVAKGDPRWFDVVRWTHFALVTAEALGVTQANAAGFDTTATPDIRRLLGIDGNAGPTLLLPKTWAADAIRAVGNWGEVWDRNITPLGVERGPNRIWTHGGLQFAPPMR